MSPSNVTGALLPAVVAWGLLLASPAAGQRPQDVFGDSVDVRLVNLAVHADAGGNPILDLERDDFELLVDGKPVTLTHFARVEGPARPPADAPPPPATSPAIPSTRLPEDGTVWLRPPTGTARARDRPLVVVLVDHPFISAPSRHFVFQKLRTRLDSWLADGAEVMLVSKAEEVEVAVRPTTDAAAVAAALDGLEKLASGDYAGELRRATQLYTARPKAEPSRPRAFNGEDLGEQMTPELDARTRFEDAGLFSRQTEAETRRSLELLRRFTVTLGALPRRKAVVYVADALPVRPGEAIWQLWYQVYGVDWGSRFGATSLDAALQEYDVSDLIQKLILEANANRVAFYPVSAGADAAMTSATEASRASAGPPGRPIGVVRPRDGLEMLASATGGRAASGRGSIDPLLGILDRDLAAYYSLAFTPPHGGDGRAHEVEVRVRRPGVRLRYPRRYVDRSAADQVLQRTVASWALGGVNPLGVRLAAGQAVKAGRGRFRLPVEVRIPIDGLTLIPHQGSHWANVTLYFVVADAEGGVSDPVAVRMPIQIPDGGLADARGQSAAYRTELPLKKGRQTIAVTVEDVLAGSGSTVSVAVDVGER